MRSLFRIFLSLAAWLMLSPLAVTAAPCVTTETPKVMPCCEGDEACEMPERGALASETPPCIRCSPAAPLPSLPAATLNFLPPLAIAFERPTLLWFEAGEAVQPLIANRFHPPPPTLLALGTQLTC